MTGSEPALMVFAHYFGGSARSWDPLVTALDPDLPLATLDLAGFGGTAVSNDQLSIDSYADQLERTAAGRPWIAVGHSMGGKIALAAAARRSAALKALILIASSPPTPEPMQGEDRRKAVDSFGDRLAAHAHIRQITDNSLGPAVFDQCVEDQMRCARSAWLWWLEEGSRLDISALTNGLNLPTLVIAGSRDKVLGLVTPFQVATRLTQSEVHVVAEAGHLAPLERPAAVAKLMCGFLSELAEREG